MSIAKFIQAGCQSIIDQKIRVMNSRVNYPLKAEESFLGSKEPNWKIYKKSFF